MIEIKTETIVTCDRCKKKIEGDTYYTIDIYGHNTDRNDRTLSMDATLQNVKTNMSKIYGTQKHICPECIGLINSVIGKNGAIKLGDY